MIENPPFVCLCARGAKVWSIVLKKKIKAVWALCVVCNVEGCLGRSFFCSGKFNDHRKITWSVQSIINLLGNIISVNIYVCLGLFVCTCHIMAGW